MTNSEIKKDELLPCPFCGGVAETKKQLWPGSKELRWWCIKCKKCLIDSVHRCELEDAIKAWNTRTPEPINIFECSIKAADNTLRAYAREARTPEPTKSENGLVRLEEKSVLEALDTFISSKVDERQDCRHNIYGPELEDLSKYLCTTFATTSITKEQWGQQPALYLTYQQAAMLFKPKNEITKEQLLAILPEKAVCKHQKYDDECGCWTRNNAIEQMKQRIEELWK